MIRTAPIAGLVAGLLSIASCRSLECAEDTFEDGDTCVGYDPSDHTPPVTTANPPGGRSRQPIPQIVTLTTDEPARIFYTTERWDLVTRMHVKSAPLADDTQRVNIQGVYAAGDTTFAIVKYGGRRHSAMAELVRLSEGLNVTGRLDLQQYDDRGFARAAFSADNSTLAIPLVGGVALVDVKTMTQIDATPDTPGIDVIDPGFTGLIRAVHFFDNTDGLVILSRTGGQAAFVRRGPNDYTVTPYQDAVATAKGFSLAAASDGKIWMAFASGIRAFDPATNNVSTINYAQVPNGLSIVDNAMWIVRTDRITLDQVSLAGAIQRTITLPVNTGAVGHWLQTAR